MNFKEFHAVSHDWCAQGPVISSSLTTKMTILLSFLGGHSSTSVEVLGGEGCKDRGRAITDLLQLAKRVFLRRLMYQMPNWLL
jgi:hypothetical protein